MRRSRATTPTSAVAGPARVGSDPRALARRLRKGDIAVIDRADLDAASAELLAARSPAAVINASPSISGRFLARGAQRLAARGMLVVDVGDRRILAVSDGDTISIATADDGTTTVSIPAAGGGGSTGDDALALPGTIIGAELAKEILDGAQTAATSRIPMLAASALDLLHKDGPGLVDGAAVPSLSLDLAQKDVLVVTAGPGFKDQLAALRRAIRGLKLVVIATGDAADAVAEHHRIDVIVGPLEAVSDAVLARASEVVVHGESLAVTSTRLGALGVRHVASESRLAPEDLAVAVAASAGARMIVTVGIESTLPDLLDAPRGASALLARMAAGSSWVDGRTLARLYRSTWSRVQTWLLVAIAAAAVGGALALHPGVRDAIDRLLATS